MNIKNVETIISTIEPTVSMVSTKQFSTGIVTRITDFISKNLNLTPIVVGDDNVLYDILVFEKKQKESQTPAYIIFDTFNQFPIATQKYIVNVFIKNMDLPNGSRIMLINKGDKVVCLGSGLFDQDVVNKIYSIDIED